VPHQKSKIMVMPNVLAPAAHRDDDGGGGPVLA